MFRLLLMALIRRHFLMFKFSPRTALNESYHHIKEEDEEEEADEDEEACGFHVDERGY
jgi:hypothetical protein